MSNSSTRGGNVEYFCAAWSKQDSGSVYIHMFENKQEAP
jgi:hypothetical protein